MDYSDKTKEELIEEITRMGRKLARQDESERHLRGTNGPEFSGDDPDHGRRLLSTILDASPIGISFSVGGMLRWANPAMVRIFGHGNEADWLGRNPREFYSSQEEYQRVKDLASAELKASRAIAIEAYFKRKDGSTFPGVLRISHLDPSDPGKGAVNSITDITERVKVQEALQESEERYRQLAENSLTGIYVHQDGLFTYVNQRLAEMLGYLPAEVMGKPFWEFVHPDDRELVKRRGLARGLGQSAPPHYEFRVLTKTGETRCVEVMARAIVYGGRPAILGNLADVTDRKFTEQALAEEKERLAVTLRSIGDAVISTDVEGNVLSVNSTAQILTGWSQQEAAGRPLPEIFHIVNEKTRIRCENPAETVLSTGAIVGLANDTLLISKDGTEFVIADSGAPISDQKGNIIGVVLVFRDITEQKRAADELFRSEERYRTLVEESFDGIFIQRGSKIVFANSRLHQMLDYPEGELVGMDHWLVYHPDYHELTRSRAEARMRGEAVRPQYEVRLQRKDGSSFEGEINARTITSEGRAGVQVWIRDITAAKAAERALQESEEKYRLVVENANEAIFVAQDGSLKFVNPKTIAIMGYSAEELLSMPLSRLIHPDDQQMVVSRHVRKLVGQGGPLIYPFKIVDKHGNTRWVQINAVLITWEGRPATLNLVSDITERRLAEEALRQSEQKYRRIFKDSPLGIFYYDDRGVITDCNENFVKIVGSYREALIGMDMIARLKDQAMLAAVKKPLSRQLGYFEGEYTSVTANKTTPIRCHVSPLFADDGSLLGGMGIVEDITERKRAEEILKRSKETVEALLNATSDVAFLADTDAKFMAVNETLADLWGKSVQSLLGTSIFDPFSPKVSAMRRKRFRQAVETGRAVRFEDGAAGRIYDNNLYPVFGPDGKVESIAVFTRDITEQKKAQELFLQAERIKAVGEMSGGVAHNFNNLLQVVMGSAQMALTHLELGSFSEIKRNLDQIVESSRFGAETVKRLQDFAKVRSQDFVDGRVVDLSAIAIQAIEITRPWWKTNSEKEGIKISLSRNLIPGCFVKGKESEIFEVAVNLIKNAVEAMPQGGKIGIRTFVEEHYVVFRVEDNGTGIRPENLGRIFEPFWTTKGIKGTGMGLASSYGIVRRHQGDILVESRQEGGSVFTVRLPTACKPASQKVGINAQKAAFKPRILIIDDVEPLVTLLKEALTAYGEIVFTATSGDSGLELFKRSPVDLVICDLGMEGMNGWQVGEAIKNYAEEKSIPKPIFLLLTGWAGQVHRQRNMSASGVDAIVEKPVDMLTLLAVVQELADARLRGSS
jgi:two-component system, cell cycle sensor histidine kinase and response regulator CckA